MIPSYIFSQRATRLFLSLSFLIAQVAYGEVLLTENFESYADGTWPSPAWVPDANAINDPANNQIVDSQDGSGKSLKEFGSVGGCWAALAYRQFIVPSSFVLECDIYNGSETLSGCHPYRGYIGLRQGTQWWNYNRGLVEFLGNGDIRCHGVVLGQYQVSRWYHVRVRYDRSGTQLMLKFWIDDHYLGRVRTTIENPVLEGTLDHLDLTAQEGSVWFDNVRVKGFRRGD